MAKLGAEFHDRFTIFRVWSPFAKSIAVQGDFSDWQDIALEKDSNNIWSKKVNHVKAGQTYKYKILGFDDNIYYRNDPRALALTDSDDGKSVVTDGQFDWEGLESVDIASKDQQIIYELHLGTFNRPDVATTGSFASAIEKLDYLKSLGVTTIELMPITSMSTSYGWGYAPNAIFSVESLYGGSFGLKNFIKEAHRRGLAVMLDVIYNHFSNTNDLWNFDGWNENGGGGIYFYNDDRVKTPWGGRPDYGRKEVRDFILDNVAMWLNDYHVDGFRIDSTIYMRNIYGNNSDPANDIPDAWRLMSDITSLVRRIKPDALVIAEDCAGNAMITEDQQNGGAGFDSQWDLGLPHVIRGALYLPSEPHGLSNLVNVMQQSFSGDWSKRIVFADSHDTAANGGARIIASAVGETNTNSVSARRIAILSSAIALTTPGIPMLLAGSEFLQGGDFNEWRALIWSNAEKFAGIVEAHRHLIALRANHHGDTAGLASNYLNFLMVDENCRVLVYQRGEDKQQPVIVAINFSGLKWKNYNLNLPPGDWRVRFNSSWRGYSKDFSGIDLDIVNQNSKITLAPHQVLILSKI